MAAVTVLLLPEILSARAGGAGGGGDFGGGSGGGEGLFYLVYLIFRLLPFPFNFIVAGLVVGGFLYYGRKKTRQQTVFNKIPTVDEEGKERIHKSEGYSDFKLLNPDFTEENFRARVEKMFIDIQKGWAEDNLSEYREYMSDGVYRRFKTQLEMMKILKQKNRLEDIQVHAIILDSYESEGGYDIINVAVKAEISDYFESEIDDNLNSGGRERFVEYWSYIRKSEYKKGGGTVIQKGFCPSCGAQLPATKGETARCEFCSTILNTGEFDWVLSEITQADDYIAGIKIHRKEAGLFEKINRINSENEAISRQVIEDRASDGFLQIKGAQVLNSPEKMRRFVSDELFTTLSHKADFVYNRLYLNDVTVIAIETVEERFRVAVAMRYSYQRVRLPGDESVELIDPVVYSEEQILFLEKAKQSEQAKGSLYAHTCPACGAPIEDTADNRCSYCSHILNAPSHEWIITDLMNVNQYREYRSSHEATYDIDPAAIDDRLKSKDFAFNNIMVILAADGIFDEREKELAEKFAKKWGYAGGKIQAVFDLAAAGRLSIRMPVEADEFNKVRRLMKKAAESDGNISEHEKQILDTIDARHKPAA